MVVPCQTLKVIRQTVADERSLLLTSAGLLLLYGVLKSVHVVLAAVERPSGDVHTHGVDTHIV